MRKNCVKPVQKLRFICGNNVGFCATAIVGTINIAHKYVFKPTLIHVQSYRISTAKMMPLTDTFQFLSPLSTRLIITTTIFN